VEESCHDKRKRLLAQPCRPNHRVCKHCLQQRPITQFRSALDPVRLVQWCRGCRDWMAAYTDTAPYNDNRTQGPPTIIGTTPQKPAGPPATTPSDPAVVNAVNEGTDAMKKAAEQAAKEKEAIEKQTQATGEVKTALIDGTTAQEKNTAAVQDLVNVAGSCGEARAGGRASGSPPAWRAEARDDGGTRSGQASPWTLRAAREAR
jgi:hypothetical protein